MWRVNQGFRSSARAWVLAALLGAAASPALASDPVEGVWSPEGGHARIRIAPCAGESDRLCGTIVWVRALQEGRPPARDDKNPDPRLRGRSVVGLQLIFGFRRAETGRWTQGKIYDPQSGRTYDANLRINPDGTLKVEGCLLICLGQNWRRTG